MANLLYMQRDIHAILSRFSPCFLRVCSDDRALWVSDITRKSILPDTILEALHSFGICAFTDDSSRLLFLDLIPAEYCLMERQLPTQAPFFPDDEELFPLYSLCRLLLAHPSSLEQQPLHLNRRILKMVYYPHLFDGTSTQVLSTLCSQLLRQQSPLPHLGGQIIAAALSQKGDFSCCLNT